VRCLRASLAGLQCRAQAQSVEPPADFEVRRTTHRNGSRPRLLLSTKVGDVELAVSKAPPQRVGAFFPALLERRWRIDRALWAVITEALVRGMGTSQVDYLVASLGIDPPSRAETGDGG